MRFTARMHATALTCALVSLALTPWPELDAHASEPEDAAADLRDVVALGETLPRLHSLLVSQHGQRVLEHYFNGHGPNDLANVKSVSKSILSALIGIAIERGHISSVDATLDAYLSAELAEVVEPAKARITVQQLLTMQAGLRTTSNGNYGAWTASDDWVLAALRQPLETLPGRAMQYSTGNTHLLSAILTRATGVSTFEFAREELAEPLGFALAPWPRDPRGIYVGGNDMLLTPRQMLRFGELYLRRGRAGDRQVVPSAWVEASLQPRAKSPVGEGRYYGYGWWICRLAGYEAPHAWGYGGQFVVLVPELELAIVTTSAATPAPGSNEHANRVYQLLQRIIATIASASPSTHLAAAL